VTDNGADIDRFLQILKELDLNVRRKQLTLMRFVAFPATEYDEILSGYQPGQMVER
jgi:hypothetical protein